MRLANLGLDPVLGERAHHPRDEIVAIGRVAYVLQLAAAAVGEVTAWRQLVVRTRLDRAVVEQHVARNREGHMLAALADPVAPGRDPDDGFSHGARRARPGS